MRGGSNECPNAFAPKVVSAQSIGPKCRFEIKSGRTGQRRFRSPLVGNWSLSALHHRFDVEASCSLIIALATYVLHPATDINAAYSFLSDEGAVVKPSDKPERGSGPIFVGDDIDHHNTDTEAMVLSPGRYTFVDSGQLGHYRRQPY